MLHEPQHGNAAQGQGHGQDLGLVYVIVPCSAIPPKWHIGVQTVIIMTITLPWCVIYSLPLMDKTFLQAFLIPLFGPMLRVHLFWSELRIPLSIAEKTLWRIIFPIAANTRGGVTHDELGAPCQFSCDTALPEQCVSMVPYYTYVNWRGSEDQGWSG